MSIEEAAAPAEVALPSPQRVGNSSAPRSRPSLRLLPRTLTARIVSGVLALVLVLVCAVGAITYAMLRSSLFDRLDQQVESTAGRVAGYFRGCHPTGAGEFTCPIPQGPSQSMHEWVALLSTDGSEALKISGGPLLPLQLSAAERRKVVSNPGQVYRISYDGYDLHISGQPTRQGIVVVTGLSTQETDETLNRLVNLEITAGAIALVVAFAATYFGVRFSLRRLRRVTTTAQEVSAELSPEGAGLDRRVPFTEEGTEVGELATSFNTMLAAVETQFAARVASEERMRQFLADASHELRTPLTSIRGYAELARMQRAAGMTAETGTAEDNLDRIESEGTRMSRLVEDLLTLARGEDAAAHPIEREPVDVPSLLDDVVSSSRAAFPDRPIDVEAAPMPPVLGDRDQLHRLVRNLVTNACVHTEQGRPVHVRGWADGKDVVITVADGGPGLPPEQAAQVFDRFWRADKARTRARGGSGLGMSIVATIVRAHGGTVRFDSDVEAGSVVTVRLPIAG